MFDIAANVGRMAAAAAFDYLFAPCIIGVPFVGQRVRRIAVVTEAWTVMFLMAVPLAYDVSFMLHHSVVRINVRWVVRMHRAGYRMAMRLMPGHDDYPIGRLRTGVLSCVRAASSPLKAVGICADAPSTCVVDGEPRPLWSARLETDLPSVAE
jgi:hypothetical protein